MVTVTKFLMTAVGTTFITLETMGVAQAAIIILESAEVGSTGQTSGLSLFSQESPDVGQFLGWRFHLDEITQVTAIGGHIGSNGGSFFGNIVSLSSANALPQGTPFQVGEVLASTNFTSDFLSTDFRTPLAATLDPGDYALVFGSNDILGGFMPIENSRLAPGTSFLSWDASDSSWSTFNLSDSSVAPRFVVEAQAVPEPSSGLGILAFGTLSASWILKNKWKKYKSANRVRNFLDL